MGSVGTLRSRPSRAATSGLSQEPYPPLPSLSPTNVPQKEPYPPQRPVGEPTPRGSRAPPPRRLRAPRCPPTAQHPGRRGRRRLRPGRRRGDLPRRPESQARRTSSARRTRWTYEACRRPLGPQRDHQPGHGRPRARPPRPPRGRRRRRLPRRPRPRPADHASASSTSPRIVKRDAIYREDDQRLGRSPPWPTRAAPTSTQASPGRGADHPAASGGSRSATSSTSASSSPPTSTRRGRRRALAATPRASAPASATSTQLLGGLNPSDLVIVAARPSVGKTALMLNFARNAAVEQRAKVAVFSLEMAGEQLAQRLLASESGVDSARLRLGLLSEVEERASATRTACSPRPTIYIDDAPVLHVAELRAKCTAAAARPRPRPRPRRLPAAASQPATAATRTACRRSATSRAR